MTPTINIVEKHIHDLVEARRPPEHVRPQLDIVYSFEKNTLIISEKRPSWMNENEKMQNPVLKTRYIKSQQIWKIYWMRASGKWELYESYQEAKTIHEVFQVLKEEAYSCFWG